jgi:prevent-host-death family protein
MRARTTGVRDAKAQLSRLLRDVQRGREWVITDHGKPVARLVPASAKRLSLEERLRRLEEVGLLEAPRGHARNLPPPLPLKNGLAQRWLREGREA